jgi:hypothetical protein
MMAIKYSLRHIHSFFRHYCLPFPLTLAKNCRNIELGPFGIEIDANELLFSDGILLLVSSFWKILKEVAIRWAIVVKGLLAKKISYNSAGYCGSLILIEMDILWSIKMELNLLKGKKQ